MPSAARRTLTRRERTAASIRRTTDAASTSAATRRAALSASVNPSPPSRGPTRRSTSARCSSESPDVACAIAAACRSEHSPAVSAAMVAGRWVSRARLKPTKRSPRVGDSRRANATSDATDRATSRGAICSRDLLRACTARACAADEAPLTRSSSAIRSTRSRSLRAPTSTEPNHARNAVTGATERESGCPTALSPPLGHASCSVPAPMKRPYDPPLTVPPAIGLRVRVSTVMGETGGSRSHCHCR